jgi:ABC-type sugar transport system substrate-binding protein
MRSNPFSAVTQKQVSRRLVLGGFAGVGAMTMLSACGQDEEGSGDKGLIAYAAASVDFFFYVAQAEALRRAAKAAGYGLEVTNAQFDGSEQVLQSRNQLDRAPVALLVDPLDGKAMGTVTSAAKSAGVPMASIDGLVDGGELSLQVAFDNHAGGKLAAERTVALLTEKFGSPSGKVLNAYGSLNVVAWADRKAGFEETLAKYPDITLISRPTNGAEAEAKSVAAATLSEHPDLAAAHAPSDSLTRGVIGALDEAGAIVPSSDPKHVVISSIDGEPMALDWVRDGTMDVAITQDPVAYAEVCMELLAKYTFKDKAVPESTYENDRYFWKSAPITIGSAGPQLIVPASAVTKADVEDPTLWGNRVGLEWGLKP